MEVTVRTVESVSVVDLDGSLVAGVGDRMLRETLNRLIGEGQDKILLNLSGVSRIDSSGVGELVGGMRLAREKGSSIKLVRVGDRVRHVLKLSQILPIVEIYESESEALAGFESASA